MIAQRFRPVVWVVGCSFAATALYTVSLGVASERSRLEDLDHSIAMTRRDIRQLQTEMGTRASLRQLERWNGEVLALSAPTAGQFRATEAALRTIDGSALPADGFAPPPVMVAAATRPDPVTRGEATAQAVPAAKPAAVRVATATVTERDITAGSRAAATEKRPTTKAQRFAMLDRALVDKRTFSEILDRAEDESRAIGKGKAKSAQ
jgi:hypothetical protein